MAIEHDRELKNALQQIEKQFGKGSIMQLGDDAVAGCAGHLHRRAEPRHRPGRQGACRAAASSRSSARKSSGKTTVALHAVANAQKAGRRGRLHRRRARPRSRAGPSGIGVDLESLLVSQPSNAEEALQDRRDAGQVQRGRHHRHRLGGRPGAAGRDRGRDRRYARRPAGPAHEPGAAHPQPDHRQDQDLHDLHQPDSPEDRRHVRQPGDDLRRPGPQVLQLGPPGHPQGHGRQGRRGDGRLARQGARWSRTRSRRRSARPSST